MYGVFLSVKKKKTILKIISRLLTFQPPIGECYFCQLSIWDSAGLINIYGGYIIMYF